MHQLPTTPDINEAKTEEVTLIVLSDYEESIKVGIEGVKEKIQLVIMYAQNENEFKTMLRQYPTAIAVIDVFDKHEVASDVLRSEVPILAIQDEATVKLDSSGSSTIEYVYYMQIRKQFSEAIKRLLESKKTK